MGGGLLGGPQGPKRLYFVLKKAVIKGRGTAYLVVHMVPKGLILFFYKAVIKGGITAYLVVHMIPKGQRGPEVKEAPVAPEISDREGPEG